jgi:hypothetical protein
MEYGLGKIEPEFLSTSFLFLGFLKSKEAFRKKLHED